MKVAIIGSRNCSNFHIKKIIENLPPQCTQIISGGADGIDTFARRAAESLKLQFVCFSPDYEKYGKTAPVVRNRQIVECADMVLAFWDFQSRGTAHTIAICIEKGTPVRIFGIV